VSPCLCDTGPLVSLIDRKDPDHARCVEAARHLPSGPLLTTWPCFTEAMYLLGRRAGRPAQDLLWTFFESGRIRIHVNTSEEFARMRALMVQYRDSPMDLADASLVAAAEVIG
jgi:predicted nucleic acid-binding protein